MGLGVAPKARMGGGIGFAATVICRPLVNYVLNYSSPPRVGSVTSRTWCLSYTNTTQVNI